jgi:hypothetical protein
MMPTLPKPVRVINLSRLAFARSLGCIVAGKLDACQGGIEAHHVIFEGEGRTGSKVSDELTVGLCMRHHACAAFRTWFELNYAISFRYEIEHINTLYRAHLAQQKPKRERRPTTPKIEHIRIRCACKQSHDVKKFDYVEAGLEYYCRVKRQTLVIRK